MKTRVFVIHYPPLSERKTSLMKQLDKRGITAEWIEHWNKGDDFVNRVKQYTNTKLPDGHLSCYLKRLYVYDKMVNENISHAIILEDDVIIDDEFDNLTIESGRHYMRLGLGLAVRHPIYWNSSEKIKMSGCDVYDIRNPGGGEATWVSNLFAQRALRKVCLNYAHDIGEFALLNYNMQGIPVCTQFGFESSMDETGDETTDWRDEILKYSTYPKYDWNHLKQLI